MNNDSEPLPTEVNELTKLGIHQRKLPNPLQALLTKQRAKFNHQSIYINQLIEAIQLAKQQYFSARSDEYDADQLSLLFNEHAR